MKSTWLRSAAFIAVLIGAAGSVGFTLYAGRRNKSAILLLLFAVWVLSPFLALILAAIVAMRRPFLNKAALYSLMPMVALGSLAIYGYVALGPPRAKVASIFLLVPPASLLLIAIVLAIAARFTQTTASPE